MEWHNYGALAILTLPNVVAAIYAHKSPSTNVEDGFHTLWRYVPHNATLTAFA